MLTPSSDETPTTDAAGIPSEAPAPPQGVPWTPGQYRDLSDDDLKKWQARIERGEQRDKQFHPQWERGLERYAKALRPTSPEQVDALLDYRHVESKKAALFHRTPEVTLTPVDPLDEEIPYNAILPLRQKVLNHELGPKGVNAKRALHKTLVDTLAASGWMITVLGYEQVSAPDPVTGVSVPLFSRRFISPLSAKKLIVPDDFDDSSDYDAAPWLAYKGRMPVSAARRMGWSIPDEFEGSTDRDEAVYKHVEAGTGASDPMLDYTVVWYKASLYDPLVWHPDLYRCLILGKGLEAPAWHVDSPFQTLEGVTLTDDSLIGNPIHVGTLRDLPDSAHVPSDLVMGEQLSTELNKFRTDLIRNRRGRRQKEFVKNGLGQETIQKIVDNEGPVPLPDEYFDGAGNQNALAVTQQGSEPRDNFTAQDYIERDFEEAFGQGANQRGQTSKKKTTATEARIVQGNSAARAETEKDRIRDYFVGLVRKFDTILQRTATPVEVQKILGMNGATLWEQWKVLPGKYAYDILPDSGQWVDIHQARSEWLQKYELLRRDPRVNEDELLAEGARLWNRDPAKFIKPPADKTLEPPKMSVSVDLVKLNDPVAGRVYLDLAANSGIKHAPETIALMAQTHAKVTAAGIPPGQAGEPIGADQNPEHGGAALKAERLNKHQEQRTGGVQGVVN